MTGEHEDGADCWCEPTVVWVPDRASVVYAHHHVWPTHFYDHAERAAAVFAAIADVQADPDDD